MHHRKLAFCSLFLYYSANVLSTVLSILIYLQEDIGQSELVYFIIYFTVYGIDKFVCLFGLCVNNTSKISWILDIFQVGFLYYPFKMIHEFYLAYFLAWRVVPQTLLELIFFFYAGILRNIHISNNLKIAIAINYILFIADIIALIITLEIQNIKKKPKIALEILLNFFPYYISIATLSYYTDSSGLNLAFYQLFILILILLGIFVIKYPKFKLQKLAQILGLAICNNFLVFKQIVSKTKIYLEISAYFSQLLRCIILIGFSHQEIFDFQQFSSDYVRYIFTYLTFGLTILELVLDFKKIFIFLFKTKVFSIQREEDISNVNDKLNNRNNYQILVEINLKKFTNQQQVEQKIQQTKFKNEILILAEKICQLEYEQINFKNRFYFFQYLDCYYETISIDFQNIHTDLLNKIIEQMILRNNFFQVIISRTEKGFLFTKPTQKMIEKIQMPQLKNIMLHNLSSNLQLTSFYKYLHGQMSFNPKQIIYDLYDV